MEEYIRWFATLDMFYQILFAAALFVGVLAVFSGAATGNGVFVALGTMWAIGGPGVIWIVSRWESDDRSEQS